MSPFEKLEGMVVALSRRVAVIESQVQALGARGADDLAAQRVAQRLGFDVAVLRVPASLNGWGVGNAKKKLIAKQLRAQGWSCARIARALVVSEKSAGRWTTREREEVGR